ncbi:unnamed protein product [Rotaria magnacalcarata]
MNELVNPTNNNTADVHILLSLKVSKQCSWYIESSLDTDKKRRWRAKKKDQHHRTQNASHQYSSGINENFMFFCVKN